MPVVTSNDRGLAAMATLRLLLLSSPSHLSDGCHSSSLSLMQTPHSTLSLPPYHNFGSNMLRFMQTNHAPPFRHQTRRLSSLHRHKSRSLTLLHMRRMRSLSRLFVHTIHGRLCRLFYHSSTRRPSRPRHQVTSFTTRCYQTNAPFTSQENLMVTSHACTTHDRCTSFADTQIRSKKCRQIAFASSVGGRCASTGGRTCRRPATRRRNSRPRCVRIDDDVNCTTEQRGSFHSSCRDAS